MLFGKVPITAQKLMQVLIAEVQPEAARLMGVSPQQVNSLTQAQKDKCTPWTQAVKDILGKLGEESGYCVFCSGKASSHELMLDVLWCSSASACSGIVLACESEWNYAPDVSRDFQKLLVVKAPLKLLIYTGREPMGEAIRVQLKRDMELYPHHVAGEEYVFIGLCWGIGYAHHYLVPTDGRQFDITFEPLAKAKGATLQFV
jgi:hypothetical protein